MVTDIFTQPLHHKKAPDGPDTSRTFSPQSKSEERQLPVGSNTFWKVKYLSSVVLTSGGNEQNNHPEFSNLKF